MYKRLITACIAITAFVAFVIPPAASAGTLTHAGTVVPVGTKFIATNTGVVRFTGSVTFECSTAHLTGTVVTSSTGHIKEEIRAADANFTNATGGDCTSNLLGTPAKVTMNRSLCLTVSKANDNIVTDACGSKIQFTAELIGFGPCKYEQVGSSITSAFETNKSPVSTTLTKAGEAHLIEGGYFCPTTVTLDMTFDFYTDVAEDTKNPLTIS